jgi:hypothetical protein
LSEPFITGASQPPRMERNQIIALFFVLLMVLSMVAFGASAL